MKVGRREGGGREEEEERDRDKWGRREEWREGRMKGEKERKTKKWGSGRVGSYAI